MLAVERKNRILEILRKEKIVRVEELAEGFGVSVMTVRRDLEKCESEGIIERCHGGAVLKEDFTREVLYADKMVRNLDGKELIAARAADMVKPGGIIFLDAGTTIFLLARKLIDVPGLTIVTNDLAIASLMSENSAATVIMLGGVVINSLGSVHGAMTDAMLRELRVETAFVGGQTINKDFDLFNTAEAKASFRRLLLRQTGNAYLLVDASKFYKQSLYRVHNLGEYAGVITDKAFMESERRFIAERNINMMCVGPEADSST